MSPEKVFGVGAPINPIILSLRRITSTVNAGYDFHLDDLRLSPELYEIEYQLHLLKDDTTSSILGPESKLIGIAMHIYLYVVIRHIPPESQIITTFLHRMRAAVKLGQPSGWNTKVDENAWFLWLLFVGFGVSTTLGDSKWFLERLAEQYEACPGVGGNYPFIELLKRVLWHEVWCKEQYKRLIGLLPMVFLHDSI